MPVTPEVRVVGDRVVILLGPKDHLVLDLFHALKLSEDLANAGRELMKP